MENRENEIRRKRLVFGIVGSLLFIFLGWYLYSAADKQTLMPSNILEIIGIVAMVFFGCAALIGLKKYLE
jgi:drug/metabolite transporter (DMT)-like permease